jgi:hypothetical protein
VRNCNFISVTLLPVSLMRTDTYTGKSVIVVFRFNKFKNQFDMMWTVLIFYGISCLNFLKAIGVILYMVQNLNLWEPLELWCPDLWICIILWFWWSNCRSKVICFLFVDWIQKQIISINLYSELDGIWKTFHNI